MLFTSVKSSLPLADPLLTGEALGALPGSTTSKYTEEEEQRPKKKNKTHKISTRIKADLCLRLFCLRRYSLGRSPPYPMTNILSLT